MMSSQAGTVPDLAIEINIVVLVFRLFSRCEFEQAGTVPDLAIAFLKHCALQHFYFDF